METKQSNVKANGQLTIKISDVIFILRKRMIHIVLMFLAFALLGFLLAENIYAPAYYATSSLVVEAKYQGSSDPDQKVITPVEINFAMSLIPTYTQILRSNRVMDYVISKLDLDIPIELLRSYVTLTSVEDTSILHMTVTCPDPQLAIDISNAIAEAAPKAFQETIQIGSVNILDAAFISGEVPNSKIVYAVVGGFFGFVLSCIIFVVLDLIKPKIISADDVENAFGLPVIGEIGHISGRRAKKGLLLSQPGATDKFIDSYMTIGTVINHILETKRIKRLLVTGAVEGEGKTLFSANLAMALAKNGRSVLLIDCSLRKPDLGTKFKIEKSACSALYGYENKDGIKKCIAEVSEGLSVLPFIKGMDKGHVFFTTPYFTNVIREIEEDYDYLIFDSAPVYEVTDTLNLVSLCDAVLMVVKQDCVPIVSHKKAIEKLNKVDAKFIGCVLNDTRFTGSDSAYLKKYNHKYNFSSRKGNGAPTASRQEHQGDGSAVIPNLS